MDFNVIRGVLTLVFLIFFLGVIVYAWSKKNKARFDEAAMLPLNEPQREKKWLISYPTSGHTTSSY